MSNQGAVKSVNEDVHIDTRLESKKSEKISEFIYREIKNEILRCELKPGVPINESAFARRYDVSRTPVREAFARLIQEELIQLSAGGSYSVTPVTVKDVHEVFALRVILEGEAAELAASKSTEATVAKLKEILTALEEIDISTIDDKGRLQYVRLGRQFHLTIAEASRNRKLLKFITQLMEAASRYVFIESRVVGTLGIEESHELLIALEKHDGVLARKIMQDHIEASYQRTKDALLSGSDVQFSVMS